MGPTPQVVVDEGMPPRVLLANVFPVTKSFPRLAPSPTHPSLLHICADLGPSAISLGGLCSVESQRQLIWAASMLISPGECWSPRAGTSVHRARHRTASVSFSVMFSKMCFLSGKGLLSNDISNLQPSQSSLH